MGKLGKVALSAALLGVAVWFATRDLDLKEIWAAAARFDAASISLVLLTILLSTFLAAIRLHSIAKDLGFSLTARESIATLSLGQVGGALAFQIFGQLVARGAYLKKRNVPVAGTVLITAHERIGSAAVSLGLAICGALYLFHRITIDLVGGGAEFIKLAAGLGVAVAVSAIFWRKELLLVARNSTKLALARIARATLMSGAVQLAMMAAYVIAGRSLSPGTPLADLVAASTLVMFAASIPVSFAGWGVRELSAVAAMGAIGLPADRSLAVALLIGLISILSAVAFALASMDRKPSAAPETLPMAGQRRNIDAALANILPILVAAFIFFQILVPASSGNVNVNLADPLALLGATMFLVTSRGGKAIQWRLRRLPVMILGCTLSITLAFLIGAYSIGWTEWATTKFFGWFVLISYGMTGALALRVDFEKTIQSFAIVGCAIILYSVVLIAIGKPITDEAGRISGFAQNSNAFAFQCVLVLSAALGTKHLRGILATVALFGVWLTGSRAGLAAAFAVLCASAIYSGAALRLVRRPGLVSLIIFAAIFAAGAVYGGCELSGASGSSFCSLSRFAPSSIAVSNAEHLLTTVKSVEFFMRSPIFGSGLGVFFEQTISNGRHIVVHSTLLWLLAEFGLVGVAAFAWPLLSLLWREAKASPRDMAGSLVLLSLTGFAVMSLAHELMYQRALWFVLGAALAVAPSSVVRTSEPVSE